MRNKDLLWSALLLVVTAVTMIIGLSSCGDDPKLSVSGEIKIDANGTATGEVLVTAEHTDWLVEVTEGNDWLQAYKNGSRISVVAKENTEASGRTATLVITATEDPSLTHTVRITQAGLDGKMAVTPTSVSLLATDGSSTTISISTNVEWQITNIPEWLHLSATSGKGNTQVTLTAKSDNFSDEPRSANISISAQGSSAGVSVSQEPLLAKNCRVNVSNATVMSDGFACDLSFGKDAKGYREAFFPLGEVQTSTEKDIYNKLMEKTEYSSLADWTVSPIVNPGTTIVYCIAAYGNENKADNTHKYGPMTMTRITATSTTIWADMYVGVDYDNSNWYGITKKYGSYGTRCSKYYYFAFDGEDAELARSYYANLPYAYLAHFVYKPTIAQNPDKYAVSEQVFPYYRTSGKNQFFFGAWGIDDNGNYSAEHAAGYVNTASSNAKIKTLEKNIKVHSPSEWDKNRHIPTRAEILKLRQSVKVFTVNE